jgi:hypothetical protein
MQIDRWTEITSVSLMTVKYLKLSGESVCSQNICFLINFDAAAHPREL